MKIPDGLVMQARVPITESRHDWALYIASNLDEQLHEVCNVNGVQFYFHGDTKYNRRNYVDVPFAGGNLSAAKRAAKKATRAARITKEWMYEEIRLYWTTPDFKRVESRWESWGFNLFDVDVLGERKNMLLLREHCV